MRRVRLGSGDLEVSEIGFGCMSLDPDAAESPRLIERAVEAGITLFDTADLYDRGRNEALVGRALAPFRERVVIATKVGNEWLPDGNGWRWNPNQPYILAAAEESLRRLGVETIDLLQLHGGTIDDPIDETIEAFERLSEAGKIRAYGLSSIRPNVIRQYLDRSRIASVMTQHSLLDRRPEESSLGEISRRGVGLLIRGALAKGLLAGKPPTDYLGHDAEGVGRAAAAVAGVAGPGRGAAETAIRYSADVAPGAIPVVGIRTAEHLDAALRAADAPRLTAAEIDRLGAAAPARRYDAHR